MKPDDFANFDAHSWSWDWLSRNLGVSPNIRPADMDGYIHQRGELLLIDGKVTKQRPTPSIPQLDLVHYNQRVTLLIVHTSRDHWDYDTRQPHRISGYSIWPSTQMKRAPLEYRYGVYVPYAKELTDEQTLSATRNLIVVWTTWAGLAEHPAAETTPNSFL